MKTFKIRDISGNTITILADTIAFEHSHVCFWAMKTTKEGDWWGESKVLIMAFLNGNVAEVWEDVERDGSMSSDTGSTTCAHEGCEESIPNHKWARIKSGGWFEQLNGDVWCPNHIPEWVDEWRKKKAKQKDGK